MRFIISIILVYLNISFGDSLTCFTCATPSFEFSDSFDNCQNFFSEQKSFFPFEDNPKCYNGAFCAKFILNVVNKKVTIRKCISREEIVDFDPENPPSPTKSIKTYYKGYNVDAYFCENNYCNGALNTKNSLLLIVFLLSLSLYII